MVLSLGNNTVETNRVSGSNPVFNESFFLLVRHISTGRLVLNIVGENKLRRSKPIAEVYEDLVCEQQERDGSIFFFLPTLFMSYVRSTWPKPNRRCASTPLATPYFR